MNINIYGEYRVMIHSESSTLSEENSSIYDNIFHEDKNTEIININGGKLLDMLSKLLDEQYISEFTIVNNTFIFKFFNYNNGENWTKQITVLEDIVKETKEEKDNDNIKMV